MRRALIGGLVVVLLAVLATIGLLLATRDTRAGPEIHALQSIPRTPSFQYSISNTYTRRDDAHIKRRYPHFAIDSEAVGLPAGVAEVAENTLDQKVRESIESVENTGIRFGYESVFQQGMQWQIDIDAKTGIRTDRILTVELTTSVTYGGDDQQLPSAVTMDMATGQVIGLDGIFAGGDSTGLREQIKDVLDREAAANDEAAGLSSVPVGNETISGITSGDH
jgi:hypothetical protein